LGKTVALGTQSSYIEDTIEEEIRPLLFDWDDDKAEANLAKHGVSFIEARSVFKTTLSADIPDPDHSEGEERWIKIGPSISSKLLVVCYTERRDVIRIISARKADRRETKAYEEKRAKP